MSESGMTYKEMLEVAEEFSKKVREFSKMDCVSTFSNETEKMKSDVCNKICRYSMLIINQKELDNFCSECPLNKVKRIELEN